MSKIDHLHPEVQKYIRERNSKAGAAGTGDSKSRGDREHYAEMGRRSWENRTTDFQQVAKDGWVTRRANAAKRAAEEAV